MVVYIGFGHSGWCFKNSSEVLGLHKYFQETHTFGCLTKA